MRALILLLATTKFGWAEPMLIEDFTDGEATGWSYVSDRVMGGVSDGGAAFLKDGDTTFARLSGQVSTANNGGFIQIRHQLTEPVPDTSTGLSLTLRGNRERYFVHLRPNTSRRPWQYYAASFEAPADWSTITLSWSDFTPQGGLPEDFEPTQITSLGLVAYGANFTAELDVKRIGLVAPTS